MPFCIFYIIVGFLWLFYTLYVLSCFHCGVFSLFILLFIVFALTCCEHHSFVVSSSPRRSKHANTVKMIVSIFTNTNLTMIHTDQDTNLLILFYIIFFFFPHDFLLFVILFKSHIWSIFVVISFSLPFNIFAHMFLLSFCSHSTYFRQLFFPHFVCYSFILRKGSEIFLQH